jgi:hypothetical protein
MKFPSNQMQKYYVMEKAKYMYENYVWFIFLSIKI